MKLLATTQSGNKDASRSKMENRQELEKDQEMDHVRWPRECPGSDKVPAHFSGDIHGDSGFEMPLAGSLLR